MSEVNWNENARAAAMEFACYIGKAKDCKKYFEHITPRKAKTVEDAVEYHKEVWPNDDYDYLNFDSKHGWYCSDKGLFVTLVCTREQFEACAAKKGEKWTHTHKGINCKVLYTQGGESWIKSQWNSELVPTDSLKPIKPMISKAQAWDKCQDYDGHKSMKAYMYDLHEEYDII